MLSANGAKVGVVFLAGSLETISRKAELSLHHRPAAYSGSSRGGLGRGRALADGWRHGGLTVRQALDLAAHVRSLRSQE
jgi:hypothetical protein